MNQLKKFGEKLLNLVLIILYENLRTLSNFFDFLINSDPANLQNLLKMACITSIYTLFLYYR